ncbi:MAG: ligase-associated DNA damage response DEXH box helicase [Rhodospirillaceae bacterium]|nr:ligase-associated DNA damage response DEXH box helicase [Rhodospirillaceae bacterium]MYH35289.1 ligase-associated DNA damage response DEXH box helicase [Rhodospirillaceae bacterium]MYK13820.1 ligase-associated DNA damage response DEXH box helicase [Rhodospirillaceae bacterium]
MNAPAAPALPPRFADWFAGRGWAPHPHQLEMLAAVQGGRDALLIAPTGAGKTLAGFLPSLIGLAGRGSLERDFGGLHTLYISPLKALAVDIARNLEAPVREMALDIRCETRTGDTPHAKRTRQRKRPPDILMTTPESLSLLLTYADAARLFGRLRCLIVDELHALMPSKRGDLLALAMARLATLAPEARRIGLSATVHDEAAARRWLAADADGDDVRIVRAPPGADPEISIVESEARIPWSGHMALHALPAVYEKIREHRTTLVFVNTRGQAEIVFRQLWRMNEDGLAIALHHGSLEREQRRKVEAAMARGALRAVVCTSSLDLGIDWGDVDLVVQMGAPKGASRLLQRLGRANHRYDEPSRAILVPGNRFEFMESRAAIEAVHAGELDGEAPREGGLDVLAQHLVGLCCGARPTADELFAEVRRCAPYAGLSRRAFDDVLDFVATGGYALGAYERFKRLTVDERGRYHIAGPRFARQHRMNAGVIVEAQMLKVRAGGRNLGQVEEYFVNGLVRGDTFIFAGEMLEFNEVREMTVHARKAKGVDAPKVPAYGGGRLPLTTNLADRVRAMIADPAGWSDFPDQVRVWLDRHAEQSVFPQADGLLVETFPRQGKIYTVAYCFEGRNAHQTLGMLLTRRMERAGLGPLGFVATDYVIAVWSLERPEDLDGLFDPDMLGDDLEAWMAESTLLKRTFRNVATIAGLIERNHPGQRKTGRQVTFSADLIYNVLRRHEPNHILLRATRQDAATGLTDIRRLGDMLTRVQGRIRHQKLDRVSPLAVPILLEIGRESVAGEAVEDLLAREEELVAEAGMGGGARAPNRGELGSAAG